MNWQVIPPKQKFLNLKGIYKTYGQRPVIVYKCKMGKKTPLGGYVIAVMDEENAGTKEFKAYMEKLSKRFIAKAPFYFIRMTEKACFFDDGTGEIKALPEIQPKPPTGVQKKVDSLPEELVAAAIAAALSEGFTGFNQPDEEIKIEGVNASD